MSDNSLRYRTAPQGVPDRRPTDSMVRVVISGLRDRDSFAIYRHPEDIPLPTPAKATIANMDVAVRRVGRNATHVVGRGALESAAGRRRDARRVAHGQRRQDDRVRVPARRRARRRAGLCRAARRQASATEFVLTELANQRAVFQNPRHDYPQQIVYDLSEDGALGATIGFINGGRGTRFEFTREGDF